MLQKFMRYTYNLTSLTNRLTNARFKINLNQIQKYSSRFNYENSNEQVRLLSGLYLYILPALLLSLNGNDGNNNNTDLPKRSQRFNFIAEVVEIVSPSLVQVTSLINTPLGPPMPNGGSGFIVSEDGVILTNAHVVQNKREVQVKLSNGRIFNAVVIRTDPLGDVAALKIDCNGLKALKMADTKTVRPGEFVVALGSPLFLGNTVTSGIVSNVSRDLGMVNRDIEYVQTDATIERGNSGGPLVNLDGEVIGMNTLKITHGISFAVPSNYLKEFLDEVFEYKNQPAVGKVKDKRYYFGIKMFTLRPDIIDALNTRGNLIKIPNSLKGCLVAAVEYSSPAHRAGLRPGDIIVKVNDKEIEKASDLFKTIKTTRLLKLAIIRNNEELELTVRVKEY